WHADGSAVRGFPGRAAPAPLQTIWVALADLDGDHRAEIVTVSRGGHITAFGRDGLPLPGWPVDDPVGTMQPPLVIHPPSSGGGDRPISIVLASFLALRALGVTGLQQWLAYPGPAIAGAPGVAELSGNDRILYGVSLGNDAWSLQELGGGVLALVQGRLMAGRTDPEITIGSGVDDTIIAAALNDT